MRLSHVAACNARPSNWACLSSHVVMGAQMSPEEDLAIGIRSFRSTFARHRERTWWRRRSGVFNR